MSRKAHINRAIKAGNTVYLGPLQPLDESGEPMAMGDVVIQTRVIVDWMAHYLEKADMTLANLVSVTVYLHDIGLMDEMDYVYRQLIPEPYPVLKVVVAHIAERGVVIEMTAIASSDPINVLD